MKTLIIIILSVLFLAGCANFVDKNGEAMTTTPSQQYAGILQVNAVVNGAPIELISGKESQDLSIEASFDDSGQLTSIDISAKEIAAFEGQAISAQAVAQITDVVFTRLTEAGVNVTRAVVEGAVKAALGRP